MLIPTMIVAFALGGGQAVKPAPPPVSSPELAALVERVVRISELERQKLVLERERAELQVGDNHPDTVRLRSELQAVEAAIRLEGFQSYQSEAQKLAAERAQIESDLAAKRRLYGQAHPLIRAAEQHLASVRERQRVAAVTQLSNGMEAHLRAAIAAHPDGVGSYLDLASLYVAAQRVADAEQVLTGAMAALKRVSATGVR